MNLRTSTSQKRAAELWSPGNDTGHQRPQPGYACRSAMHVIMNKIYRQTVFAISLVVLLPGISCAQDGDLSRQPIRKTTHLRTVEFTRKISGEERLIFVPENRRAAGSREITVSYVRIPAQTDRGWPPVVVLPGGPGQSITCDSIAKRISRSEYSLYSEIAEYSKCRDVLIVNQRGVSGTSGNPQLPKYWLAEPPDVSKPMSFRESEERLARGLRKTIKLCEDRGFDLRGYDISHLVDDVEAVRKAHGYQQLAFRGASFGSQWALAYLRRYPSNVDRMFLSGVEPVDYGYDSPEGIWNVIDRVDAEARRSQKVNLPAVGLARAVRRIIEDLEKKPVRVRGFHPRKHYAADVMIGVDDFRHYLLRPLLDSQMHSRRMLELWPKFVSEIYAGDYQYLAAYIIVERPETTRHGFLLTLVDNSIGVSTDRAKSLAMDPTRRWLGDVNWFYTATRSVCPRPSSRDDLRVMEKSSVPVLLVQGTLDLATPLENAVDLIPFFPNGKLLTVTGGTHAATYHAASVDENFPSYLTAYMNSTDPAEALDKLPQEIQLPPLRFQETSGTSLFTMLTEPQTPEERSKR